MARFIMVQVGEDSYDVLDSVRMNSQHGPEDYHMAYNLTEKEAIAYCDEVNVAYTQCEREAMKQWTNEDLAMLTEMCLMIADQKDMDNAEVQYCDSCQVTEVTAGDKYCATCTVDIVNWLFDQEMDDLAQRLQEQIAIDKGLY